MRGKHLLWAMCLCLWLACGDDDATTDGGSAGDGDGDAATGDGDGDGDAGGDAGAAADCDVVLEPSDDDTETMQTALIEASSGDVICLSPGTYRPTAELSLSDHLDVTLRGIGASRDDVLIDFADQTSGDDGIVVSADGFTIEHLSVKNTPGNGIVVNADDSVFRDLKVWWDAGSVTENGAYAVYPTTCTNTLVENVEVEGASDAGIYVGQCTHAIVRGSIVRNNVIGIEVENTTRADVYDNTVEGNSLGILAIILPNLEKKDGGEVLIRENRISGNDHANFAEPDTTAGTIPPGAGILLMGMKDVEIRDNEITDQSGPGIFIASYEVFETLSFMPSDDPETDKWPERVYVHGNTIEDTGAEAMGNWSLIEVVPFPPVFWDGVLAPGIDTQAEMEICLGEDEQAMFLKVGTGSIDDLTNVDEMTDDVTDHMCELDPLPELEHE